MHVLGTPPAFVLSQDQTLKKLYLKRFHASNHFLNNRFWQLTQEFSLAVFAYASNKSINLSKVFCSSLRYSIYKVQPLSALAVSSLILARRLPFVKNFFQVFSNFSLFRVVFRPRRELSNTITALLICQVLFPFFSMDFLPSLPKLNL